MVLLPFLPVLLWGVAFSLAFMLIFMRNQLQVILDDLPLGFGWLGKVFIALIDLAIDVAKATYEGAAGVFARLLHGLADHVKRQPRSGFIVAGGVTKALTFAWDKAIPASIKDAVHPVSVTAHNALAKAEGAATAISDEVVDRAEAIRVQAGQTLTDADTFARANIAVAKDDAMRYADSAVAKLQGIEDKAVRDAIELAKAGEQSVAEAATAAIAVVDGIARGAQGDVIDVWKYIDRIGLAGLVASIPALAVLVNTIAQESGLENESCRTKVKGICGTDPAAWESLLLGIAAVGVGFSLGDIIEAAGNLVDDAGGLLAELSAGVIDEAPAIGGAIGNIANRIAQAA